MPSISLIIATYNWPEALNVCLLSLKKQTSLPLEIIIADDGSSQATNLMQYGYLPWRLSQKKSQDSRSVRRSNLAFWKSDFLLVNGYDNTLTGWGHEDEELAARFINNEIWKKSVKFRCIQYHLYHKASCYGQKPLHVNRFNHTNQSKLKACINGVGQLKNI